MMGHSLDHKSVILVEKNIIGIRGPYLKDAQFFFVHGLHFGELGVQNLIWLAVSFLMTSLAK
jgi:hypothetical protein